MPTQPVHFKPLGVNIKYSSGKEPTVSNWKQSVSANHVRMDQSVSAAGVASVETTRLAPGSSVRIFEVDRKKKNTIQLCYDCRYCSIHANLLSSSTAHGCFLFVFFISLLVNWFPACPITGKGD